MELPQPPISDTPKPRSKEQIEASIKKFEPIFNTIWETKDQEGTEPVPLPYLLSGNGLPIRVTMREIPKGIGYVIGLYEDRKQQEEAITPIGYQFLHTINGHLVSDTGDLFAMGVRHILYNWDPVKKTYPAERPTKEEIDAKIKRDPYILNLLVSNDAIEILDEHQRRGLATTLYDLTMLLARKTGQKSVSFNGCNESSSGVINKLGYRILEDKEDRTYGRDFEVEVP